MAESGIELTFYSRAYCHLCDEMLAELRPLQRQRGFELRVVDVDSDEVLERRYGERVPVLAHGPRELCHCRLDAAALTAYLNEIG